MNYDLDTQDGTANAIAWTQAMLDRLNNTGVWIVPRSGSLVHFNQEAKAAKVVSFLPDHSLARVLTAMGFTVTETVA